MEGAGDLRSCLGAPERLLRSCPPQSWWPAWSSGSQEAQAGPFPVELQSWLTEAVLRGAWLVFRMGEEGVVAGGDPSPSRAQAGGGGWQGAWGCVTHTAAGGL